MKPHSSSSLRNRFGVLLSVGMFVRCAHPRGGSFSGEIKGFELTGDFVRAYGKRVNLIGGMSASVDDCTPFSAPPALVCVETLPDGSAPIRLSFAIKCF